MLAGFARLPLPIPLGTRLTGWWSRDLAAGCDALHDPCCVRALWLAHEGSAALLVAADVLFLGRPNSDRLRGALGRRFGLPADRILLNASHTHAGPDVGDYGLAVFEPPPNLLLEALDATVLAAAESARATARPATIETGATTSRVPVCRRRPGPDGAIANAPYPDGLVYDRLPIVLFRDRDGRPIALVHSVACHPTTVHGRAISADFPGVACDRLDHWLGVPGAIFCQGCGGDAKPRAQIGNDGEWVNGPEFDRVTAAGELLADEVIACVERGLEPIRPSLAAASVEVDWPLQPPADRAGFAAQLTGEDEAVWRQSMVQRAIRRQLDRLDRGVPLATAIPVTLQALSLGEGLRLVTLEGEPTAPLACQMEARFPAGLTVPLGYTNGAACYLVTGGQMAEGGYEPNTWQEYDWPAPPAAGFDGPLAAGLDRLVASGI